ncbi:MAG: heavy metal-binding domain-containing protein [Bacteroidota bacterium]
MFTSCGSSNGDKETDPEQEQVEKETAYICPMKCEGDKTYKEAGACPVCGMDLVEK